MSDPKYSGTGADWTQLLTDPALVSHLGELLQVYREAPAEKRDQALLEAMRNIKGGTAKAAVTSQAAESTPQPHPQQGRNRHPHRRWQPARQPVHHSNRTFSPQPGARIAAAMLA
jgi:hypothetical protein